MKLQKSIFILLILLVSFQICVAQEKPKAVLLDEFGGVACDEFLSRLDAFLARLKNNLDSIGYAIIYPEKNSLYPKGYETWIFAQMYFMNFDSDRVLVKYGERKNQTAMEFWIVPAGAEKPTFMEREISDRLSKQNKAFRLATSVFDICPTLSPKRFADYLQANPSMRGHIVVFNKSIKEARNKGENLLKILTEVYKVPRNQLKVVPLNNRQTIESEIEFWLVPQKRK